MSGRLRVVAVIPAHNEQETIAEVVRALLAQSHRLEVVAVVLDRCTDRTPEIVQSLSGEDPRVRPVVKEEASYDQADFGPLYAEVVNWGIRALRDVDYDAIAIVDADTVVGRDYVERAVDLLRGEPRCAIAGVRMGGKDLRGSGSVIRRSFLEEATGGLYPEVPAPDTYLLLKALALGYTVREIPGASVRLLRPSFEWPSLRLRVRRHYRLGRACWWLGYHPAYLLGRAAKKFLSDPPSGVAILLGYLSSAVRGGPRSDVADLLRRMQVERMKAILRGYLLPGAAGREGSGQGGNGGEAGSDRY